MSNCFFSKNHSPISMQASALGVVSISSRLNFKIDGKSSVMRAVWSSTSAAFFASVAFAGWLAAGEARYAQNIGAASAKSVSEPEIKSSFAYMSRILFERIPSL